MLVHALAAYADTYLRGALEDPSFERKPVPYAVVVFDDGAFAGVRERTEVVLRGKKTVSVPLPLDVPKSPVNRNSAIAPLLGCDGIQYVAGPAPDAWTSPGDEAKHERQHAAFAALVARAAVETEDPWLGACARFYADPAAVAAARADLVSRKVSGAALVALTVESRDVAAPDAGGYLVERAAARDWWRRHYDTEYAKRVGGDVGMCLVSGTLGPIAPTHDKVKGTSSIGGQASGVALMSFDKPAFQSYGWEQNANAPVSPGRAAAYVLALNDLLRPGVHRQGESAGTQVATRLDAGGVALLFWTRRPSDDDWLAFLNVTQPAQVAALLAAPHTGYASAPAEVEPNDFYLLAVSATGARLVVRDWFHDHLGRVRENMRAWFAALRVPDVFAGGAPADPPPLWRLRAALSPLPASRPLDKRLDAVPAERVVQLARRALEGVPLGHAVLSALLARLRAERGDARLDPVRMALVRLCVNDLAPFTPGAVPVPETLDPLLGDRAYVCGRLLAVYESLQYQAHGGQVNVSVVDRYYATASTNPNLAFRNLRELSLAHLRKLRRERPGAAVAVDREITALHDRLGASGGFPGLLGLEAQGRFALGYYQQKADAARRIAEAKAARAEVPSAAV